ncbi:MAG: hypothetical protein EOL87_10595 [Spartobacteria bacterium]|nr:hypothetical protein [Spartobacteria bacterium]
MSFLKSLTKMFSGGQTTSFNSPYCIVDAATLDSEKGERLKLNPKNQMDILRRLSRFASKEKLEMGVVFEGKPLRDAPPREKYQNIMVYYAETPANLTVVFNDVVRMASKSVMVVTSNAELENAVRAGRSVGFLHGSTMRKALDANGCEVGEPSRTGGRYPRRRPQGGGSQRNSSRRDRGDRGDRGDRNDRGDRSKRSNPEKMQENASESTDVVSNLIDAI